MNELTRESRQGQGSRWRNTLLGGLAALAMVALGAAVIRAGGAAPTREEAALTRQGAARGPSPGRSMKPRSGPTAGATLTFVDILRRG